MTNVEHTHETPEGSIYSCHNTHTPDNEDDPEPVLCPTCGGEEHTELGALGNTLWLRCRQCGMDFHAT